MGSERVMAVVVVGGGGGWWWGGGWWVVVVVGAAWGGCEVSAKHAPLVSVRANNRGKTNIGIARQCH